MPAITFQPGFQDFLSDNIMGYSVSDPGCDQAGKRVDHAPAAGEGKNGVDNAENKYDIERCFFLPDDQPEVYRSPHGSCNSVNYGCMPICAVICRDRFCHIFDKYDSLTEDHQNKPHLCSDAPFSVSRVTS